jgi:hypothetical protein
VAAPYKPVGPDRRHWPYRQQQTLLMK